MNYTSNYNLNQWEADDRVQRTDFNADNAKIDAVLGELAKERIAFGSYVGDGTSSRIIQLPWAPRLMLLQGTMYDNERLFVLSQDNFICVVGYLTFDTPHEYCPLLNGSTLELRYKDWCNQNGRTFRYMLIR